MQGRKEAASEQGSLLKEWCIDRVWQGAVDRSILMGKRSPLGDFPGSSGSLRQQAMGEKLTHQGKGIGGKMDGCMSNQERKFFF